MITSAASTPDTSAALNRVLRRYERMIEISQQLTLTLDPVAMLRRIIDAAKELTDSEASSILLIDPSTGNLHFEQASNISPREMETIVVPMDSSIAGWVVTHGEPRVIEDVTREPRFFGQVDDQTQFRTRNLLAVPMRTHQKVIGTLEALNKLDDAPYDDDDIKILMTLASQAALAIENARMFHQRDFMSEMVHELRTPLAALKTSLSLLGRADLPVTRREDILDTASGETERLIRLTSEYLDLARMESGRTRLEASRFDFGRLVLECVEVVAQQAGARGIEIETPNDTYPVYADRGKTKQVILNLLTNAIKYNRENGRIRLRLYESIRHEEPFAELSVADTGMGISKEHQRRMFQRFFRVSDGAGGPTGTGLGLAIAKTIVESHGGEIWLESELEVGTTFYFTLPIAI